MFPTDIFDEKKASQAAAYFLFQTGGRMELPVMKLIRLLYLAERTSFELFSEPLIGDRLLSLPHGPILSITYDYMNGEVTSSKGIWTSWMKGRVGDHVGLQEGVLQSPLDDLLELSDADIEALDRVWEKWGHLSSLEIGDLIKFHCREWRAPDGPMALISYNDLFEALEFSQERKDGSFALLEEKSAIAHTFKESFA
jgi:uncharacterized phage-associated protein